MRTDAILYVLLGMLPTLTAQFGTDDASKYIDGHTRFWILMVLSALGAAAGAYKGFRSVSFARHLDRKADEARASGDTAMLAKANELKNGT